MRSDDTPIENLATIQSDMCSADLTLPTHDHKTLDLLWYQHQALSLFINRDWTSGKIPKNNRY